MVRCGFIQRFRYMPSDEKMASELECQLDATATMLPERHGSVAIKSL